MTNYNEFALQFALHELKVDKMPVLSVAALSPWSPFSSLLGLWMIQGRPQRSVPTFESMEGLGEDESRYVQQLIADLLQ